MIRHTKNIDYICPNCLKQFKVEHKRKYPFQRKIEKKVVVFCSYNCKKEYLKVLQCEKILFK